MQEPCVILGMMTRTVMVVLMTEERLHDLNGHAIGTQRDKPAAANLRRHVPERDKCLQQERGSSEPADCGYGLVDHAAMLTESPDRRA